MYGKSTALAVLAAFVLAPPAVLAHSHKAKGVEVVHPWTPATEKGGGTTRVFMKIKNLGGVPERLIGASTVAAAKTELQEPAGDAGKPIAAVVIEPGKEAQLTLDGPHLVLTGLKNRLDAYDSFKLTLVFEKAGRMVVDVAVEEAATEAPHKH
jgi:copper(I)-binding protein